MQIPKSLNKGIAMTNTNVLQPKQQAKALFRARRDAAFQQFLCKALGVRSGVAA